MNAASSSTISSSEFRDESVSRTHQYRKVMKPLLERKRRARINKCLDDLKDLMVTSLRAEGETITKLEKADVLELTVRYLRNKKKKKEEAGEDDEEEKGKEALWHRYRAGYAHCVREISEYISTHVRTHDEVYVSTRLLSHLGSRIGTFPVSPTLTQPPKKSSSAWRPWTTPL